MEEKKKLGIALVGLGNYAQNQLTLALKKTKNCYLAGVVTGTPEKAEKYRIEHDIPPENIYNYETFDSISENPEIDVVYVVLPNSMHKEFTIRAAQAGKHVICEKPMANSVEEAEEMIRVCEENNVRLFIGYRLHFEPFNLEVRKYAEEKPHGDVKSVEAAFAFDTKGWRLEKDMAGGGPLVDAGIYCIQAMRYAIGMEPETVRAEWSGPVHDEKYKGIESEISWEFMFPKGVKGKGYTAYHGNKDFLKVQYEEGHLNLENAFMYNGKGGETHEGKLDFENEFEQVAQLDEMSLQILKENASTADGQEGLTDMIIIEAIYEAARTGEKVEIGVKETV